MASPSSVPPSASHLFRVFIDSSLDTHLTMDISSSDTVAALKRMIETEHPVCFPDIGQITVRSVKVNRSGQLYNMVNPMLIISPFEKVQRPIFLQIEVEAAQAPQQIPNDQNLANNQNEANVVLERGDLVVSDFPSLERGGSMDFSPNLPHAQETLTDPNPMERLQNEKDGANPVETDANPIEKLQNEKDNTNPVEADALAKSQTLANADVATDHPNPNPEPKTNSNEDSSKQDKKKKRRKTEAKSTVAKIFDETVYNAQIDVTKPSETETLKSPKRKSTKLKSKEKNNEIEAKHSTMLHNLNTDEINFIDYFSPDEPKKRLKDPNPSLVGDVVYLSDDNTEDENDAKHAVKWYKVAVRKVPVKRKTGDKNKSDASRKNLAVSNDEGFDGSAKMKKGGEGKSKTGEGKPKCGYSV